MNSRRIIQIKALAVVFASAALLAGCGGGGGSAVKSPTVNVNPPASNTKHGAVYSYRSNNLQEFRYYYGGNTQAWINNHALTNCRAGSSRSSCTIEAAFTNCVALARDNRIRAYATGNDLASARSSALAQCRRLGGTGCSNFSSNCNAPVTRQASKVGGTSNSIPSPTAPTEQPTPPPSGNVKHGAVYSWQGSSDNKRYARVSSSVVEDTAAAARSAALNGCTASNCRVEFTFTNCAAVADSDGFEYTGIATGNTLASARSSALAECTRLGGAGCELDGSERCNDPVAPQTSIVRGISNSAPAPAPTVTLSLADSSISENGGTTTVTATLSQASGADTTITVTAVSGSYTVGEDATISIAAGSTSNSSDTATINAVDNTKDEPDRTATVTATAQNSQGIGAVTGASLTLEDDDGAPTVTLSLADSSISENGGTTTVTATLSHASSADTTITVTAVSGSYTVGEDATITIAAGSTSNNSDTATINAVDNTRDEADRTATVTATAQNTQGIGAVTGASLTLEDDDGAPTSPPSSNTGHGAVYSYTASGGQRVVGYHGNEDTAAEASSSARAACNALRNAQGCRVEFTYRNVATASSPSTPSQPSAPSGSNVHYGAVFSYPASGGGGQRILSYHGNENTIDLARGAALRFCFSFGDAQCTVEQIFWTATPVSPPTEQLSGSTVRYGAVYSYYDSNGHKRFYYHYQTSTRQAAENAARSHCMGVSGRTGCHIEDTFTNCVALGRSSDGLIRTYGTGNTLSGAFSAESSAEAECERRGGTGCSSSPGICINPVTSELSKSGGNDVKYGAIYSYTHIQIDTLKVFGIDDTRYHGRAIVTNKDSEEEARREGLAACQAVTDTERNVQSSSGSCRIEDTFTNCVAIAEDVNHPRLWRYGVFGYATGNTESIVKSSAISQCERVGGEGADCDTVSSAGRNAVMEACNNPITPQASKTGGSTPPPSEQPTPPSEQPTPPSEQPTPPSEQPTPPSEQPSGTATFGVVIEYTIDKGEELERLRYSTLYVHPILADDPETRQLFYTSAEDVCPRWNAQSDVDDCRIVATFTRCGIAASGSTSTTRPISRPGGLPGFRYEYTWFRGYGIGNDDESAKSAALADCGHESCRFNTSGSSCIEDYGL